MFRKKLAILVAAALMTLTASSAFAAFADLELIRVVYERTTGTVEKVTDLGNVKNIIATPSTTFAGSLGTVTDPNNLYVAYFAIDRNTTPTSPAMWVSGSTDATKAPLAVGTLGFNTFKSGTTNMYSYYNIGGLTPDANGVYTGAQSYANSYRLKLTASQGSLSNAITIATRVNTEANLAGLVNGTATSVSQNLYYFANGNTANSKGAEVATITTNADGSTTISNLLTDGTPPVVTIDTPLPVTTTSATVSIGFTATDSAGVTGYLLNEVAAPPLAGDAGWVPITPDTSFNLTTNYTFSGLVSGALTFKTLYVWAKDAYGNVSAQKSSPTEITLSNTASQTISFGALPAKTYGDVDFAPGATASSGLTVTYTSSNTAVATIDNGQVHIIGAGSTNITASQAGDANFGPATDAVQALTVNKAISTIAWATPSAIIYGMPLSATQLNATANVDGTFEYVPAPGSVPSAGTQILSVTFTPTDSVNYATATKTVDLTVNKATPTVTWATPAAITYGMPLSATQLNATASVPGTFEYVPASGSVPSAGTQILSVTFTPTDSVNYATATKTVDLTVNKAIPTITWATPSDIFYGISLSATQLNATASVPGTFVYTPAPVSVPSAGTQILSVTFTPTDSVNYAAATKTVSLTVNKAAATVSLSNLNQIYDGAARSATVTTTPADLSTTVTYNGSATMPTTAGTYTVVATISDANYSGSATGSLIIAKATPSITWATPAAVFPGSTLGSSQLNASASVPGTLVYTPAAGTIMNTAGNQTLSVSFTPNDTANYDHAAATVTLTVNNKQNPTVTWATPAAITYDTPLSATQLNAAANVPGSFTYTPASGTVLNAGSQSLSVTFTPNDSISYAAVTTNVNLTVNKAAATFTISNLNQIYDGTARSATATTTPAGLSTTVTYNGSTTAPTTTGTYTVVTTINDANYSGSATGSLIIAKATPFITWAAPAAVFPGSTLDNSQLNATANVPGTLVYTPAAGTIMNSAGNQTLSVAFTPNDTANYNNANATVTLTVNSKQNPTVTWATPAAITYGTPLSATQLNAAANVPGSFTYTPASGAILNAGSQTLTATFTPTDAATYNSTTATVSLTVNKATATVTLSILSQSYDGSAKSVTPATTPVGLSTAISYNGSATVPTTAGTYAVVTTINDANYSGSTTGSLVVAKATPSITWATPAAIFPGSTLGNSQLNASASVPGTLVYTPAAGTTMNTTGNQTLSVAFTPSDTANYNNANATVTLTVNSKQNPTVTWANPATITFGTPLSATQLNAAANVPGTFAYTPAAGAVLNAGSQTLAMTFTPDDSTTYASVTSNVSLTVNKADATVVLNNLGQSYDGSAKSVTPTTTPVGLSTAITYNGSATAPAAVGTYTVVATINDVNYTGNVTGSLVIAKATPSITWTQPAAVPLGSTLGSSQFNATASVTGTLVYTPAAGTIMNTAGNQTLSVAFTPNDTANYNNANATVTLTVNSKQSPTVTWANPAAITYGTPLSATQLNATASVPGTFVYTPALGSVSSAGTQTLSVTFIPIDSVRFTSATATVSLTVHQATPAITWLTPAAIDNNTPLSVNQLNATAGVPGTFVYNPPAGSVLKDGTQTLLVTFTPNDSVNYAVQAATVNLTVAAWYPCGASDCSKGPKITDALKVLKYAVHIGALIPDELKYYDVAPLDAVTGKPKPDGKIDVGDALVILKSVVGSVNKWW